MGVAWRPDHAACRTVVKCRDRSRTLGQTIEGVLSALRAAATSSRDLGDRFERLMAKYLRQPLYADELSEVWLWA